MSKHFLSGGIPINREKNTHHIPQRIGHWHLNGRQEVGRCARLHRCRLGDYVTITCTQNEGRTQDIKVR